MRYSFKLAEHEEFGSLGWQMEGSDIFEPLNGIAVAHDILEHGYHPQAQNMLIEELMALGAYIYIRGEDYHYARGYTGSGGNVIVENMSEELGNIYSFYCNYHNTDMFMNHLLIDTPKYRRQSSEMQELFDACAYVMMLTESIDVNDRAVIYENKRKVLRIIRYALSTGYRNAMKRYSRTHPCNPLWMFQEIEREANRYIKMAEAYHRLIVNVCISKGTVDVHMEEDWDE